MYARQRQPKPYFQCSECKGWLRVKKDGQLFSHNKRNPDYQKQREQGVQYPRYMIPCEGVVHGYVCPCCDGTGRVGEEL